MDENDDEISKMEEAAIRYLPKMTPEEYLEWEDKQERRHEYIDGEIILVEAATTNHNRIVASIVTEIGHFLKGKHCEVFVSQMRVAVKSKSSYFYPDASIFCEEPEETEESKITYKNPSVVFEVLSPSTADYDMGRKLFFYMQIDSLKEYVIIDSRKIDVRIGRRTADNSWKFETYTSTEDILTIETIRFPLKLSEIYGGVKFR